MTHHHPFVSVVVMLRLPPILHLPNISKHNKQKIVGVGVVCKMQNPVFVRKNVLHHPPVGPV
jgi:hypothetical protein